MQLWGHTDIGNGRADNQDCIYGNGALGLMILADGMGGQNGGEVASQKAVFGTAEVLEEAVPGLITSDPEPVAVLIDATIAEQNLALFRQAEEDPRLRGMGCTLVVVVLRGPMATIANVGDSRCYHYRDGVFQQVTRDHSLAQAQIDSGIITEDEAEAGAVKNVLMRAVGVAETVSTDIFHVDLLPGDYLMTCSDGMLQPYNAAALEALFRQSLDHGDPARFLVDQAVAAGTTDNVSVQVARV
jgi:PPM family protein phosphatase